MKKLKLPELDLNLILIFFSICSEYLRHSSCSETARNEFETCAERYKDALKFMTPLQQENQENLTLSENLKTICWYEKENKSK